MLSSLINTCLRQPNACHNYFSVIDTIEWAIGHKKKRFGSKFIARSNHGCKYVKSDVKSTMNNDRMYMIFSNINTFLSWTNVFPNYFYKIKSYHIKHQVNIAAFFSLNMRPQASVEFSIYSRVLHPWGTGPGACVRTFKNPYSSKLKIFLSQFLINKRALLTF